MISHENNLRNNLRDLGFMEVTPLSQILIDAFDNQKSDQKPTFLVPTPSKDWPPRAGIMYAIEVDGTFWVRIGRLTNAIDKLLELGFKKLNYPEILTDSSS